MPGGKKDMVPRTGTRKRETSGLTLAKNKARFRSLGPRMSGPPTLDLTASCLVVKARTLA